MATESYGRCDDGVHWVIYHELPLGQWWWMVRPEGGERIDSPRRYPTEGQALAAVEAARAAVVAGRPVVETMASLRARAEAAEVEAERLRSAIAETLRLADIYAGVAAHNAEAEPETAGEAWRSAGAATVREMRRALGGAA